MSTGIDWNIVLAVVAIGLTLLFGIWGVTKIYERKHTQKQVVKDDSTGIQSGRDTKIEK